MGAMNQVSLGKQGADYMTPEAVELIQRAKALAPRFAERAQATYREGRVPDQSVK